MMHNQPPASDQSSNKSIKEVLIIGAAIAEIFSAAFLFAPWVNQDSILLFAIVVVIIISGVAVYWLVRSDFLKRISVFIVWIFFLASLALAVLTWSLLASSEVTPLQVNITDPQDEGSVTRLSGPYPVKGTVSDPNARVYVLVSTLPETDMWVQPPVHIGGDGNWEALVFFGEERPRSGERYRAIALATNDNFLVTWATGNWLSEGQKVESLPRKSNKSSFITVTRSD